MLSSLAVFAVAASAVPPAAQAVLDQARAASGGDAWTSVKTSHEQMTLSTAGMKGSAESWEDVLTGRYLNHLTLGPSSEAEGFDGKKVWEQDTSKQSLERGDDDARQGAIDEAYRLSMAYWFPERWPAEVILAEPKTEGDHHLDVVRITPQGGRPFEMWFDSKTHLLDRVVEKAAQETRTTFFSDYRTVQGVKIAYVQRSTNGETKYDKETTLSKVVLNAPIDPLLFAMPAPPPPDYAFAGGKKSTTLPFELINNHIYIDVKLNGAGPFRVLCDTGGANVITPTVARKLGVKPQGALQGRGVGEKSEDVGLVKIGKLQLGDVTVSDQLFATFAMEPFEKVEGVPQSGLVGYEIFKRFVVTIDYQGKRLTLADPAAFQYQGKGTVVPFKFVGHDPQVDGQVDGVPGAFLIDTGSRASLDLMGPFVAKHGMADKYPSKVEGVTGWGVGGPARASVIRISALRLGGVEIKSAVAELSLQKKGAFSDEYLAGNVGAGVLKRFTLVFDYGHQKMIFEPNDSYGSPDVFDRSGSWINRDGKAFEVVDVIAGGPAARAGLKAGDRVVAVDGKAAAGMTLPELRARFRTEPAGTHIRLTVQSGGKSQDLTLELADLV
jgi:predicted aspartyl protease